MGETVYVRGDNFNLLLTGEEWKTIKNLVAWHDVVGVEGVGGRTECRELHQKVRSLT